MYGTLKNEAMNNSVQCYAPKIKRYVAPLCIVASVMALGYDEFWTQVFVELGLELDDVFASSLRTRDQKKGEERNTEE